MKFLVTLEINHGKESFTEQTTFMAKDYRRLFNSIQDRIEDRGDGNNNVKVDVLNITQDKGGVKNL